MATTTLSNRNTPVPTQGTLEPIRVQANTHPAPKHQPAGQVPNPAPVQQASPEATQAPPVAEDPQLSSKFAALARKEKAIRQRSLEIQKFEQELKDLRDQVSKATQYRERLKKAPLEVLQDEGVTYDQLVQHAQGYVDPNTKQVLDLQAKVQGLEAALQRQQEDSQKSQQAERAKAERQISMDVKSLISSQPDKYETVRDMGAEEAITQLILTTYDEEGIRLSNEEAAKQVDAYLQDEIKRIAGIPSAKKLLAPPAPIEPQQPTTPKMTTLSHTMAPNSLATAPKTWAQKKADIVARYSKKA